MNFLVNRKLAVKYGVREAMVLNKIRAELLAREVMNYPKRAGKHWCRMSYKVLAAKLPVLTVSSAGRILRKRLKKQVYRTDKLNPQDGRNQI